MLYEDSEFFVKLTCYFKEYVQAVYHIRIKGMTSSEMLYTIDKLPRLQDVKKELGDWLRECDFFKFTGTVASRVRKQEMQRRLAELAGRIKTANQAVVRVARAGNRAVGRAPQGAAKGLKKDRIVMRILNWPFLFAIPLIIFLFFFYKRKGPH